jgi:hypothetical protein
MASRSQENTVSVDKKKQELLRRIEEKKRGNSSANASSSAASVCNANNSPSPSVNPILFNNDGNFLARFRAMQQQQCSSPQTPEASKAIPSAEDSSKKRKATVSMKVKTINKQKTKLSRFDVFETPEEETGNYSFLMRYLFTWESVPYSTLVMSCVNVDVVNRIGLLGNLI